MDIFESRAISPMLIGRERNYSFDDEEYIFELLTDGARAFAFLSRDTSALVSRRKSFFAGAFPELEGINSQVANKCILDGEVMVMDGKVPDHDEYVRRLSLKDPQSVELASLRRPATFVAHDVVYCKDRETTDLPLWQRKNMLQDLVAENECITVARYVAKRGVALFSAAGERGFEGVVAKNVGSLYRFGELTRDWVTVKHHLADEFVVCGYASVSENMARVVLGQYDPSGVLLFRGQVPIVREREDFRSIKVAPQAAAHPFPQLPPEVGEGVIWLIPCLVCTVSFASRNEKGAMRQPVFRQLRWDLSPDDVLVRRGVWNGRNMLDSREWRFPYGSKTSGRIAEA